MKERFWLKPTAILLGIFAWFYVNIFSESPITREVRIKIKYLNIDDRGNYRVVPKEPEVKLIVRGPRGVFIRTKIEENTSASVDLINCHGGKLTLPVNVILPSNSNLELVSKEPAQLVVNMIPMASRLVPVTVRQLGTLPEGYMNSVPHTTPEDIMVTAPENVINTIKECRVDVDLKDVRSSISEYKQAHVVYSDGMTEVNPALNLIEILNSTVKLDMAVREGYPEKMVTVKPETINRSPEGRRLESITAIPDKVTVTGPSRILDTIDSIALERIDLATIHKSSTIAVTAICPKGLKIVGNSTVTLAINYADVSVTKLLGNLPLEITSGEDQLVEPSVSTYSIEIEGLIDDINAINLKEVNNIICVKGLTSGTHDLKIETPYGLSERVKVKNIIPATIPVTIDMLEKVTESEEATASDSAKIKENASKEASATASTTVNTSVAENASNMKAVASATENLPEKK